MLTYAEGEAALVDWRRWATARVPAGKHLLAPISFQRRDAAPANGADETVVHEDNSPGGGAKQQRPLPSAIVMQVPHYSLH